MTDSVRAEVEQRRAIDALCDSAEARLMNSDAPHLVEVAGEEPMICDFREAAAGDGRIYRQRA